VATSMIKIVSSEHEAMFEKQVSRSRVKFPKFKLFILVEEKLEHQLNKLINEKCVQICETMISKIKLRLIKENKVVLIIACWN